MDSGKNLRRVIVACAFFQVVGGGGAVVQPSPKTAQSSGCNSDMVLRRFCQDARQIKDHIISKLTLGLLE